jgi:hypothetical protein
MSNSQNEMGSEALPNSLILLYIAIFCYFTGFLYVFLYYKHFDISITASGTPAYYFFVYSYNVASRHWFLVLLSVIIAILSVRLMQRITQLRALTFIPLVLLFPMFSWLAARTADSDTVRLRRGISANVVRLVFKPETLNLYPDTLKKANEGDALLWLAETPETLYVLFQPEGEKGELPNAWVFRLKKSDLVLATTVTPGIKIVGGK